MENAVSLSYSISMGGMHVLGCLLFASRIPERYFPGKCDIWVSVFFLHNLLSRFINYVKFLICVIFSFKAIRFSIA
jgi:hypothetical protein